ncbi:hypothetical protein [Fredinandcohnia quinoae]|uniref:Uncharacterized protein n=1 Tax=Fredinandcohnia quinoae TaxID=2918902 RepID=A0AAW5E6W1_9BACI|nr:hypothetical protein [Fredinandcohnia sp. SECRCQ15]MCH1626975.1 hypothetical protein [Fredinandcohnia sp. SECRCQ15]
MTLIKNCVIVLLFGLLVVGMIFYGVKQIDAKEKVASNEIQIIGNIAS